MALTQKGRVSQSTTVHATVNQQPGANGDGNVVLPRAGVGPLMTGHCHCRDVPSRISSIKTSLRYLSDMEGREEEEGEEEEEERKRTNQYSLYQTYIHV